MKVSSDHSHEAGMKAEKDDNCRKHLPQAETLEPIPNFLNEERTSWDRKAKCRLSHRYFTASPLFIG